MDLLVAVPVRIAMPVQFQKPWINSAPRWWMTQRPRPCMGAAYDHLRRASIVPRGADHRKAIGSRDAARSKNTRGSGVCAAVYPASAAGAKRGSPSLALDPALVHTSQILIMSRRPPRCRRAEANSPTLELSSGTDGPWFDLVITQWYPTGGRIGALWRRSLRLAWSLQSVAFAFSPLTARTTRSSRISASQPRGFLR